MPKPSYWVANLQILALSIHPLRMLRWTRQTTSSGHDSTEDAEVKEAEAAGSRRHSVNTFTENNVVDKTQTTSSGHVAIDTSIVNAEVEEAGAAGSRRGSVHTFTENAVETPTTNSGHDSTDTPDNAEVKEAQTPGTGLGSVSRFTDNAGVDETQTTNSGLVYDVRPWRRKRLDMESVTQLEELQEVKMELQRQIQMEIECKRGELVQKMQPRDSFISQRNFMRLALKDLSDHTSVALPPFPKLSLALSSLLTRSSGDTPNIGVDGAASAHADSLDHGVNNAANAYANPQEDHIINVATKAHVDSSDHV